MSFTQTPGVDSRLWPVRDLEWITNEEHGSSAEVDAHRSQHNPETKLLTPDSSSTAEVIQDFDTFATSNVVKSAEWQIINVRTFVGRLLSSTSLSIRTSTAPDSRFISAEVDKLFTLAKFIDLEPGMANEFSEGLEEAIEKYGELALGAVESLILNEETKSSIAMEAMQYIGYTDSGKWHDERRRMLERCLRRSRSAWVRDGAGLGLASLDDPKSIPALEKAIRNETSGALKGDLILVLHQLRDTLKEQ